MCALLILAGDVETNPGPKTDPTQLEKLQTTLDRLLQNTESYQKENTDKLNAIQAGISSLRGRVTELEKKSGRSIELPGGCDFNETGYKLTGKQFTEIISNL